MPIDFTELSPDFYKSPDAINTLNQALRTIANNVVGDTESVRIFSGYGSPESVVTAGIGSMYMRLDGGANTSVYRKESGTGNTGWVANTNLTTPISTANGGLGADASGWTAGDYLYLSSTGVIGHTPLGARIQIFTSSGTFTAPTGVTKVYLSMVGQGGGSGGSTIASRAGGGGSGGQWLINYPYTVVPGNGYTVTIGNDSNAGGQHGDGADGASTVFDTVTVLGGKGGKGSGASTGGAALSIAAVAGSGGTGGAGAGFGGVGTAGADGEAGGGNTGGGGGGSTPFGPGGTGGSAAVPTAPANNTGAGAGGSGGTSGVNNSGVKGSSGICVVMY